ncbi:MAG: alpha/beta fold hydrolase [Polyangiaceae bacterium]
MLPRSLLYRASLLLSVGAVVACSAGGGSSEDQDRTEGELGLTEDATDMIAEPSGPQAKHAIVLAHGFNASTTNSWSFYGVAEALAKDHPVVVKAEVPPFASPRTRAEYLAKDVDRALAKCRETAGCDPSGVHLIAHSMGGLDARALIGGLHYGDRVKTLTTIASPHHGTAIADAVLGLIPPVADGAVDKLAALFARTFTADELANDSDVRGALSGLAEKNVADFERENPMDPRVYVQSYAGVSSVVGGWLRDEDKKACEGRILSFRDRSDVMDVRLVPVAPFVAHGLELRPNDGMATVESAKLGEFKGCIPADHYGEIGQPKRDTFDRRTGFDHVRFYRSIAFDLARRDAAR